MNLPMKQNQGQRERRDWWLPRGRVEGLSGVRGWS